MGKLEHIVVCVDDTDDLTKETSTGAVAERIASRLRELGGTVDLDVTRHQLLLDERVPYTSHNSAMAFTAMMPADALEGFREDARDIVLEMSAEAADPGLCIGVVPEDDDAGNVARVVGFGLRAQSELLSKADAFALAGQVPWLRLEELGGTGDGAIGALAGAGLRLSGSDGRFRGKWDLAAMAADPEGGAHGGGRALGGGKGRGGKGDGSGGGHGRGKGRGDGSGGGRRKKRREKPAVTSDGDSVFTVARTAEMLGRQVNGRVAVLDPRGNALDGSLPFALGTEVKPVMRAGALVVIAEVRDGVAVPFAKWDLDELGEGNVIEGHVCDDFAFDNDDEELAASSQVRACPNCLYRRLTASGFTCMRKGAPYTGEMLEAML